MTVRADAWVSNTSSVAVHVASHSAIFGMAAEGLPGLAVGGLLPGHQLPISGVSSICIGVARDQSPRRFASEDTVEWSEPFSVGAAGYAGAVLLGYSRVMGAIASLCHVSVLHCRAGRGFCELLPWCGLFSQVVGPGWPERRHYLIYSCHC